jgi:hypothetical protein
VLSEIGTCGSGVTIRDLLDSPEFMSRKRRSIKPDRWARALEIVEKRLSGNADAGLRVLVEIAVEECGADSAGISLEEESDEGKLQFRWVVVAGTFAKYLNGTTPRFYSPCGTCLDRGAAQHYQVSNPYYNFLGVTAEPILDGVLIPWRNGDSQGTIWLVSHRSETAFDVGDYELVRTLADHIGLAMRKAECGNKGATFHR